MNHAQILKRLCKTWIIFLHVTETVPKSAAHPPGVDRRAGGRLSALFPECHSGGSLHQRSLHGGGYR